MAYAMIKITDSFAMRIFHHFIVLKIIYFVMKFMLLKFWIVNSELSNSVCADI